MVTLPDSSVDQSQNHSRVSADTPAGITDLFNSFFAPVFTIDSAVEKQRAYVRTLLYPIKLSMRVRL